LFNHYDPPIANKFMQISMSLSKIPDGASNTLMLSENTAAFHYTDEQNTSSSTTYKQYASAPNAECGTGIVWDATVDTAKPTASPAEQINGSGPPETKKFQYQIGYMNGISNFGSAQSYWFARPSSLHGGGVNAAFCDGGVRFLRDDIDYNVYQQLMTTDSAHSDMINKTYVLQDSDYK
jgi:prepilin-type processing-associated H-X9-DG protein